MKKTVVFLLNFLLVGFMQAQFSIPAPTDADALAKLKSSDALLSELKQQGLGLADVTIKLEKKEPKFLESDEVCYRVYRDSKKIEGSNYLFSYSILVKQSKPGEKQYSKGYVWYTRVDITKTTCNIQNTWTYEYSQVDAFSLETKNGLISVADAEKAIMDTIDKGLDLDAYDHSGKDYDNILTNKDEICRIDAMKTCEFGKTNCTDRYEVKNEMWEKKHIICFDVVLYRGRYETGPVLYGSMSRVIKYRCLLYTEFERKGSKVVITTIRLSNLSNEDVIPELGNWKPLPTYYVPISKTKVQNIRNKFMEGKPDPKSYMYFMDSFKGMAADLTVGLGKDYEKNLKVLLKYMTPKHAEEAAKKYVDLINQGYKFEDWKTEINDQNFTMEIKASKKFKKYTPSNSGVNISINDLKMIDGKYYINNKMFF